MKLIVVSDSHGRNELLYQLQEYYKDAEVFLHCGDLEDDPKRYPGWVFVEGNNEYYPGFVKERIVYLKNGIKIYMTHSHRCSYIYRKDTLYQKALTNKCEIVCYGHTHVSDMYWKNGVLLFNPGSLIHNRDGKPPSYSVWEFIGNRLTVEIVYEPNWKGLSSCDTSQIENEKQTFVFKNGIYQR